MASISKALPGKIGQEPDERTTLLYSSKDNTHKYTDTTGSSLSSSSSSKTSSSPNTATSSDIVEDVERLISTPAENIPATQVFSVVAVLLIGVFLANADATLVLANYASIASEFNNFNVASWIVTSFMVGVCATQPIYGKMSDIYGRKNVLIVAYILFTSGCALCGVSRSLWVLVAGRTLTGIGGAGMTCLVSIIITDLVPLRDVAAWRSYVYVTANAGRVLGGPLGGLLNDTIGWRWSFAGQCPLAILAIILVWLVFYEKPKTITESKMVRFKRIDFLGAFFVMVTIVSLLLILDIGGIKVPWQRPSMISLILLCILFATIFCYVELNVATEPIFPLRLLKNRNVTLSYIIIFFETAAMLGTTSKVASYFRVTEDATNLQAALHITPGALGNATGALLTGFLIRRTGRYKLITLVATISSFTGALLITLRWQRHTSIWEGFYLVPAGFGVGTATASVYIALNASVDSKYVAVSSSGFYLVDNLGYVFGVGICDRVVASVVKRGLLRDLAGLDGKEKIINRVLRNIDTIKTLSPPELKEMVVNVYVKGFGHGFAVSVICSVVAFLATLILVERRLEKA